MRKFQLIPASTASTRCGGIFGTTINQKNTCKNTLKTARCSPGDCDLLEIRPTMLRCRILGSDFDGREALTPRMLLRPQSATNQPCEWQRLQFPVKVSYAMTISKSQGQSLDKAGTYLWVPAFTHGMLYVAASRTGNPDTTVFAVRNREGMEAFTTKNIVFREVL